MFTNDSDKENVVRDLRKIKETLDLATTYHVKDNEKNAALHASPSVLYSPLTAKLLKSQAHLEKLIAWIDGE